MKRFSIWYWFVGKNIEFALRIFYKRIKIVGVRQLPFQSPLIFSPNHQNAFMDALVVAAPVHEKKQPSFMVRQDVFKNRFSAFWLRSLKLFPAYRIRDGYENLSKNNETFEYCYNLLEQGNGVIIFPEASHELIHRLRPLKKGLMRIALEANERFRDSKKVYVVPVGINYSDQQHFGGDLLVIYGEPIDVRDYESLLHENQAKAYLALKERIEEAMKLLILHINNTDYYNEISLLGEIGVNHFLGRKADLYEQFRFRKNVIEKTEEWLETNDGSSLKKTVEHYHAAKESADVRDWLFDKKLSAVNLMTHLGLLAVLFPLWLVGVVLNYLPFKLPDNIARKRIKDEGFKSSIRLAGAFATFPLWYIFITVVAVLLIPHGWLILPVAIVTAFPALVWVRTFNRYRAMRRYLRLQRSNAESYQAIQENRKKLIDLIGRITKA